MASGVLGLLPVMVFLKDPEATSATLLMGALFGLPLFILSIWTLSCMDALILSEDGTTLTLLRRTFRGGRMRLDVACSDVDWIGLSGRELGIGLKSGGRLELAVESPLKADGVLRDLAHRLGVRYTSSFDYLPSPPQDDIA